MVNRYDRLIGVGFDKILKDLELAQWANETNWEFRKRAFPILWEHFGKEHNTLAMEFLMLLPEGHWSDMDKVRFLGLDLRNPSTEALKKFAQGFSVDPVEFRKKRPAITDGTAQEIIALTE